MRSRIEFILTDRAQRLESSWTEGTYAMLPPLKGHRQPISGLALHANLVVSSSLDGSIRVWDITTGTQLISMCDASAGCTCLALSYPFVITGSSDGIVRVFDIGTGALARRLRGHTSPISHVRVSGVYAVSASVDRVIRVWEFQSSDDESAHKLIGHEDEIQTMCIEGDIAITAGWDESVRYVGKIVSHGPG